MTQPIRGHFRRGRDKAWRTFRSQYLGSKRGKTARAQEATGIFYTAREMDARDQLGTGIVGRLVIGEFPIGMW
jgi:hypothetical protein